MGAVIWGSFIARFETQSNIWLFDIVSTKQKYENCGDEKELLEDENFTKLAQIDEDMQVEEAAQSPERSQDFNDKEMLSKLWAEISRRREFWDKSDLCAWPIQDWTVETFERSSVTFTSESHNKSQTGSSSSCMMTKETIKEVFVQTSASHGSFNKLKQATKSIVEDVEMQDFPKNAKESFQDLLKTKRISKNSLSPIAKRGADQCTQTKEESTFKATSSRPIVQASQEKTSLEQGADTKGYGSSIAEEARRSGICILHLMSKD